MYDLQTLLKQMANYWQICECLRMKDVLLDDVKEYLMKDCKKPESTARGNITSAKECDLFCSYEDSMSIDGFAADEIRDGLEDVFGWQAKADKEHQKELKKLQKEIKEAKNKVTKQAAEFEDAKNKWTKQEAEYLQNITELTRRVKLLESRNMELQMSQKSIVVSSMEIHPKYSGIYSDKRFPMEDRHPTLDPKAMLMEAYAKVTPVVYRNGKKVEGTQVLNPDNWKKRKLKGVFSDEVCRIIAERMKPWKKRIWSRWPHKDIVTADELLEMNDKSNVEKIALYTMHCSKLTKEKQELLDAAVKHGTDANFVIRLLEDYRVSRKTKNVFMMALRLAQEESEYLMRRQFAKELLDGLWYIKASYCGRDTTFKLMPVEEFEYLQEKLSKHIKKLEMEAKKGGN